MTTHTLHTTQLVAADGELVWDFFANARTLGRIMPRSMTHLEAGLRTYLGPLRSSVTITDGPED